MKERFPTPPGSRGYEHGRVHSFRHYFVSQAFGQNASEGDIRQWVGHADSRIVERYRHLTDAESRQRITRLQLIKTPSGVAVATASERTA